MNPVQTIFFVLLVIFPSVVDAQQPKADRLIIYTHDFQPYHYYEHRKLVGINLDLVVMALEKAEIDYEFQQVNWARSLALLEEHGNNALLSMIRSESREARYQWVGPLVSSYTCLYRLRVRKDIQVHSLTDVKDYTIGLLRGGQTHRLLEENGFEDGKHLVPLVNIKDTYRMLEKGRVDLIPGSPLATPYQLEQAGMSVSELSEAFCLPDFGEANYLALSLGVNKRVRDKLNQALSTLKAQGIFETVAGQYRRQSVSLQ
ncbi:substrate-binding periplasmic protein [Lacimicrobium alkaliphilum]|uniref:Solute-binding protein family 3/N-terminal domain-containing protein n=1 Tax=Lacimicrobium alkaliphilum TaxID=1526571 RepID=A0ABQ1R0T4_9ALTE|nr:transporter substrate-binding domain-containing protein [Lacimicrobium alkaliphilum]GGD51242.1 hypothetical protein GCM10011357_03960 [Lacimicrobium alkaliphilum]